MDSHFDTEYGGVCVTHEVIARIAGYAAIECYGIVGMAAKSVRDGIARLLKRERLAKGIEVTVRETGLTIDLHIIVEYGINIPATGESIIHTVKYKVEEDTGLTVERVNLFVDGVRFSK